MSERFKRIVAFIIDWNISLLPYIAVFFMVFVTFLIGQTTIEPIIALLCFSLMFLLFFAAIAIFICRDVIFKGKSMGKRIFGLCVFDEKTLNKADAKQLLLKNIFFFIYLIDGIILLVTGKTIGDRVAGTVVLSQKSLDKYKEVQENSAGLTPLSPAMRKQEVKKAILIVLIIVGCIIAFIMFVQIVLNSRQDTEEYKTAYSYFITSDSFEAMNADQSKIRMNRYSLQTHSIAEDGSVTHTAEIDFVVDFKTFRVVCHKQNGVWQVCEECTLFD